MFCERARRYFRGLTDLADMHSTSSPFIDSSLNCVVEIDIPLISLTEWVCGWQVLHGPIASVVERYSKLFGQCQIRLPKPI